VRGLLSFLPRHGDVGWWFVFFEVLKFWISGRPKYWVVVLS